MALGARPIEVVRLMARQGLAAASGGALIGVAGAFAGRRVLRGLLVGVNTIDVPTLATVTAIFLATAAWATYLPALRAARIDPTAALRHE
jgi:putative ABC transport system permease protein